MALKTIGKLAVMLTLGGALAGCIDATVEVAVTSDRTAKASVIQVMAPDFYGMIKASSAESGNGTDRFCSEGELTEGADGSATCTFVAEGSFAELTRIGDEEGALTFTSAGPGLVRIGLPTAEMVSGLGEDEDVDAETRQMVEAYFTGHTVTIRLSGAEVVESNMEIDKNGKSAETVLPILDLIKGGPDLPEEFFAVVRVP